MHSDDYNEAMLKYIRMAYGEPESEPKSNDYRTEKSVATIDELKRQVGAR